MSLERKASSSLTYVAIYNHFKFKYIVSELQMWGYKEQ